jgi:hypothetical protein
MWYLIRASIFEMSQLSLHSARGVECANGAGMNEAWLVDLDGLVGLDVSCQYVSTNVASL